MGNLFWSDSYSYARSAWVLHSCSRLTVCALVLVPSLLILDHTLGTLHMILLQLDWALAFPSALDKLEFYPSLFHNFSTFTHHDPLIYKNYSTTAAESGYISVIGDSFPLHSFLLLDKSHTRERQAHSDQPMPLVLTASNSSRIHGSDPYHDLGPYILYTTLLCALLAMAPYPSSNSTSLNIGFFICVWICWTPNPRS